MFIFLVYRLKIEYREAPSKCKALTRYVGTSILMLWLFIVPFLVKSSLSNIWLCLMFFPEEEKWLAQYGQVERVNDDAPLLPTIDIWDWYVVQDHVSKGQPVARLVGCLSRGSSKLHPSLPTRGGRLRTASVSEVHLDLVRVSTGMTV